MKHYILDHSPDGSTKVLEYTPAEMAEFTDHQRERLTAGHRIISHLTGINHVLVDMVAVVENHWDSITGPVGNPPQRGSKS